MVSLYDKHWIIKHIQQGSEGVGEKKNQWFYKIAKDVFDFLFFVPSNAIFLHVTKFYI